MSDRVKYFAYGANRDARMIAAITGRDPDSLVGEPAIIKGYGLVVQGIDDIPDELVPHAPTRNTPRQIIRDGWDETFESYAMREDPEGQVAGTIWDLSAEERERVRDWELIDFGWFHDTTAVVEDKEGNEIQVVAEIIDGEQSFDRKLDGLNYETWVIDPARLEAKARETKLEFDERLRLTAEGSEKSHPESE